VGEHEPSELRGAAAQSPQRKVKDIIAHHDWNRGPGPSAIKGRLAEIAQVMNDSGARPSCSGRPKPIISRSRAAVPRPPTSAAAVHAAQPWQSGRIPLPDPRDVSIIVRESNPKIGRTPKARCPPIFPLRSFGRRTPAAEFGGLALVATGEGADEAEAQLGLPI
jgi:hypothetical protein